MSEPLSRPSEEQSLRASSNTMDTPNGVIRTRSTPISTPPSSQRCSPTLTHIRDLKSGMSDWRINVKVLAKGMKSYEGKDGRPDGQYMWVTLLDCSDHVSKTKHIDLSRHTVKPVPILSCHSVTDMLDDMQPFLVNNLYALYGWQTAAEHNDGIHATNSCHSGR